MWRSVFWRSSQNASRNLAATRIMRKTTSIESSSLTFTEFISRSSPLKSSGNAASSPRNLRFFSSVTVNPTENEIPIPSATELTHEESNHSDLGISESSDFGVDDTPVEAIGEDGDSEIVAIEASDDGSVNEEVYKLDDEKLESVVSLLRSDEENLKSALELLHLDLHSDFVVKVFDSPGISGLNLIVFLKWAIKKEETITVTTSLVESIIKAISGNLREYDVYELLQLVDEIGEDKENSHVLNLEIMNDLIGFFKKIDKCLSAFAMFSRTEELGFTPNAKTYYLTLEALCEILCMDWASLVCEKMIKSGVLPEGEETGNIITWFCKEGKPEDAYSVYELAKSKNEKSLPPQRSVATLTRALSKKDETLSFAQEILNDLTGETRRRGIKTFSDVIHSLCKTKNVMDAKALLLDMISKGPAPGNAVFNSIINGFLRIGVLDEAKEVLKLMESIGLKPDVFTYTVIISGYAKAGLMNEAEEILEEGKKKHEKLSFATYHSLIRGYCKIEEYEEAFKVLNEMESFGVKTHEYSKLIQSFCLQKKGLHLNATTKGLIRAVKEMVESEEENESVSAASVKSKGTVLGQKKTGGARKALNDITNKSGIQAKASSKNKQVASAAVKDEIDIAGERFLHDHSKCIKEQQNLWDDHYAADLILLHHDPSIKEKHLNFDIEKNNLTYDEPEEIASPKLTDWLKNSTPWRSPIRLLSTFLC